MVWNEVVTSPASLASSPPGAVASQCPSSYASQRVFGSPDSPFPANSHDYGPAPTEADDPPKRRRLLQVISPAGLASKKALNETFVDAHEAWPQQLSRGDSPLMLPAYPGTNFSACLDPLAPRRGAAIFLLHTSDLCRFLPETTYCRESIAKCELCLCNDAYAMLGKSTYYRNDAVLRAMVSSTTEICARTSPRTCDECDVDELSRLTTFHLEACVRIEQRDRVKEDGARTGCATLREVVAMITKLRPLAVCLVSVWKRDGVFVGKYTHTGSDLCPLIIFLISPFGSLIVSCK